MGLPVIGSKPVQWGVQLDDVCAKENIIAHLEETEMQVRAIVIICSRIEKSIFLCKNCSISSL